MTFDLKINGPYEPLIYVMLHCTLQQHESQAAAELQQ